MVREGTERRKIYDGGDGIRGITYTDQGCRESSKWSS